MCHSLLHLLLPRFTPLPLIFIFHMMEFELNWVGRGGHVMDGQTRLLRTCLFSCLAASLVPIPHSLTHSLALFVLLCHHNPLPIPPPSLPPCFPISVTLWRSWNSFLPYPRSVSLTRFVWTVLTAPPPFKMRSSKCFRLFLLFHFFSFLLISRILVFSYSHNSIIS